MKVTKDIISITSEEIDEISWKELGIYSMAKLSLLQKDSELMNILHHSPVEIKVLENNGRYDNRLKLYESCREVESEGIYDFSKLRIRLYSDRMERLKSERPDISILPNGIWAGHPSDLYWHKTMQEHKIKNYFDGIGEKIADVIYDFDVRHKTKKEEYSLNKHSKDETINLEKGEIISPKTSSELMRRLMDGGTLRRFIEIDKVE